MVKRGIGYYPPGGSGPLKVLPDRVPAPGWRGGIQPSLPAGALRSQAAGGLTHAWGSDVTIGRLARGSRFKRVPQRSSLLWREGDGVVRKTWTVGWAKPART